MTEHDRGASSRIFRAFVNVEILVAVAPGREVTVREDMITTITDDGQTSHVDLKALIHDAINDDAGTDLWTVPGEVEISSIEELFSVELGAIVSRDMRSLALGSAAIRRAESRLSKPGGPMTAEPLRACVV